jgi:striatin 1/3/4
MPDGKDFPLLNNMNVISNSASAASPSSTASQVSSLDRGPGIVSFSPSQQSQLPQYQSPQPPSSQPTAVQSGQTSDADKEKDESILESQSRTAIYRPDDKGEWREKVGLSFAGPSGALADSAWDRRPRDDDEDVKEDDTEVEEEESNVLGESEGTKVWRTKRTLRKCAVWLILIDVVLTHP